MGSFRTSIGRLCYREIFVEPVPDSAVNASERSDGYVCVHLQVVTEGGTKFRVRDLENMALNPFEVSDLLLLCEWRKNALKTQYLPHAVEPDIMKEQCYIDSGNGDVVVQVMLTARLPTPKELSMSDYCA